MHKRNRTQHVVGNAAARDLEMRAGGYLIATQLMPNVAWWFRRSAVRAEGVIGGYACRRLALRVVMSASGRIRTNLLVGVVNKSPRSGEVQFRSIAFRENAYP